VSAAYYYNRISNDILFTETAMWPTTQPPPGWALPAAYWGAVQAQAQFPMSFTYSNLGREINKGLELGVDTNVAKHVSLFANYSFQATPTATFSAADLNLPPKHRFNSGVSYSDKQWLASLSVSAQASAFWTDVLDLRYHGTTKAFTMVNASVGKRFDDGHYTLTFKAVNLFNQAIMQHIFGDVLLRQVMVELHVNWIK
jgi:outer membrane receptor protein involved in Fe transport